MIDTKNAQPHEHGYEMWPTAITFDEWLRRATEVMSHLYGKQIAPKPEMVTEMFVLYNQVFRPHHSSRTCSSCVSKVHKRMSNWYLKNVINKIEEPAAETEAEVQTPAEKKPRKK